MRVRACVCVCLCLCLCAGLSSLPPPPCTHTLPLHVFATSLRPIHWQQALTALHDDCVLCSADGGVTVARLWARTCSGGDSGDVMVFVGAVVMVGGGGGEGEGHEGGEGSKASKKMNAGMRLLSPQNMR